MSDLTRAEAIKTLKGEAWICCAEKWNEALKMAINSLQIDEQYDLMYEQAEPEAEQFAKWVAREIFDENWEYNKDAFAEIACRKLAKLGIVRAKGDEWELVEPQESEDEK